MRRGGCLSAIEMLEFQAATGDSWDAFDKRRTYCQYSKGNEHLVLVGAKSPATIAATVLEAAQQRAALKRDGTRNAPLCLKLHAEAGKSVRGPYPENG
jgi:hypothetical protein